MYKNFSVNYTTHFTVIDALMGAGKTSAAINYINGSPEDNHFIFITPYLEQVNRIIEACPERHFVQPEVADKESKYKDLRDHIKERKNIVTTHALFKRLLADTLSDIQAAGYTLIMDETIYGIEEFDDNSVYVDDIRMLIDLGGVSAPDSTGFLTWTYPNYRRGSFYMIKKLCEDRCLGYVKNGTKTSILRLFPIKNFLAFKEVFILTYMFSGQMMASYLKLHGVEWDTLGVEGDSPETYHFSANTSPPSIGNISELIHISEKRGKKWDLESLSHSWYDRAENAALVEAMRDDIFNFFHNEVGVGAKKALWTCYDSNKGVFEKMRRYGGRRLPLNARATNDYADCTAVAYPVNLYCHPYFKTFLAANGVDVDEDGFALSEMLQFIWRSAVRRGEPIDLFIPSARMRKLLYKWIAAASN